MPPSTNEAFDPETWSVATGPVPVPAGIPRSEGEDQAGTDMGAVASRGEVAELRRQLGQVSTQLERARNELLSARNELGAARARTIELEHHLHTRIVEVTELRKAVQALTPDRHAPAGRPAPTVGPVGPQPDEASR